jgi:hypothetical protein
VLAVLILGGVVAALVIPGGGHGRGGSRGGDVGLTAAEDDLGGSDLLGTGPGEDRRGGGRDRDTRGTGDDTLLVGVVKSTASGSLVVTRDGGGDVTVRTDDRTRVRGTATALADLTAGERVVVRVTGTGDTATAVAVQAPKARLTGTVTALTGDRATVVEAGGLTRDGRCLRPDRRARRRHAGALHGHADRERHGPQGGDLPHAARHSLTAGRRTP